MPRAAGVEQREATLQMNRSGGEASLWKMQHEATTQQRLGVSEWEIGIYLDLIEWERSRSV